MGEEALGRLLGGAAGGGGDQEGQLAIGLVGLAAARHHALDQLSRPGAGLGHVDVGIGAENRQGVAQLDHGRRDVGMEVEAGDQRRLRPDHPADPGQELPFSVLQVFGDHGAVQVEIDGIAVAQAREVFEDLAGDTLIGLFGDLGRRGGLGPAQGQQFVAALARPLNEAGNRQVDPGDRLDERRPAGQAWPGPAAREVLEGRLRRREGICLVLKAADRDPRHDSPFGACPLRCRQFFASAARPRPNRGP
jgi:hypothetical protein